MRVSVNDIGKILVFLIAFGCAKCYQIRGDTIPSQKRLYLKNGIGQSRRLDIRGNTIREYNYRGGIHQSYRIDNSRVYRYDRYGRRN